VTAGGSEARESQCISTQTKPGVVLCLYCMEITMKFAKLVLVALALVLGGLSNPVLAGDKDPLFIGLSSNSSPRVGHVLHFAGVQMEKGHPLTLFLNESGIFLASKAHAKKHGEQQKALAELMNKGATVIVCQYCMKQLKVAEADVLPGYKIGNPDLMGAALFKDNTRTLSW
jgi:predicted peroxiredoxin